MIDLQCIAAGLVGIATFIIVLSYWKFLSRRGKLPPGPFPLPILGNFLQLQYHGLLPALLKMSKENGPIFTVYFGSRPIVVVSGYQALKEVFIEYSDAFVDRGCYPLIKKMMQPEAFFFSVGDKWRQIRQFTLQTLKDFGMGKKSIEEPILEEIHHLVEYFRSLNEQPFDPSIILSCGNSNVLANILMGTRYDYNDKKWMKILQDSREAFHILSSNWGQIYDTFPRIMSYLPGPHRKIPTILDDFTDTLKENIRTHQETLDPACPLDYIDCFLIRMKQEELNPSDSPFTINYLAPVLLDMFLAGMESNAFTQHFGFLILIKHPEIQDKLHEEIDQVIGQTREPKVEDRSQMPYMNAVIHEIQRFADVFPMGLTRATTRDITFRGYFLAKGTNVLPMLTTALKDPAHFEKPDKFYIKHFLDDNGKFKKNCAFLPFAAGRRSCIAESLVRLQLFLFFTIILQKFTLKSEVDPKDLDISPEETSLESIPPNHKIIFIPRTVGGA
ncbi:cytochrome P450 2C16-like [Hyperolius riggenbachi]|uniref:cytochrome P450 2C16-like n=1 Tax=Hyperolius riggenbachi TaxID=752182 RepID=UPI0035A3B511